MNIAIFGGLGFIGAKLANNFFLKGNNVTIFTQNKDLRVNKINSSKIKIIEIDYTKKKFEKISFNKFDSIHFLSGNPSPVNSDSNYLIDIQTTNTYTHILLETLRLQSYSGKLWVASSVAVYGNVKKKLTENLICNPISTYGISKLFLEKISILYSKKFKLKIGIYRIFSTYGPGIKRQLIYDIIDKIYNNKYSINLLGTGKETRDLSFLDDVVSAIIILNNKVTPKGSIYNIGSGKSYDVNFIANLIMKIMNKNLKINYSKKLRNYDVKEWTASINKIKKIGYLPKNNINLGLKKTINEYLMFKNKL